MKTSLTLLGVLLFVLIETGQADPGYHAKYCPFPEDGFPQIIQRYDYPTIAFIESLHRSLIKMSEGVQAPGRFGYAVDCEVSANALTFRCTRNPKRAVVIRRNKDKTAILVRHTRFTNQPTIVLCSTLLTVLDDLEGKGRCRGVRVVHFGTGAYRRRTTIEFDLGAEIAVIDCFSNGPQNEERVYILDVIPRSDSLLFQRLKP